MEKTTGGVIKFLRKRAGLSQTELGEILGVKRGTIQKYETNAISLKTENMKTLSKLFGVSPWVFVFPETVSKDYFIETTSDTLMLFYNLNEAGRTKVIEYLLDLAGNEKYRR